MLSEKTCTVDDCHDVPQMATAITTGTISFTAIYWWHQDDGHSTWNKHAESMTAPQPHDPDASDVTECDAYAIGRMDLPFHCGKKHAHQWMSD